MASHMYRGVALGGPHMGQMLASTSDHLAIPREGNEENGNAFRYVYAQLYPSVGAWVPISECVITPPLWAAIDILLREFRLTHGDTEIAPGKRRRLA